ncbi:SlyX family protein [Marinospirillum sp.]|uniref:SlyX family protein n=1 Tax=Marinospirillum sp. TaxID=2183934 RepID=UPI0028702C7C|nr:SlyX family protein [Marinospirillum sp.]MDR9468200.1 SlyX family protein [Marinospirillum sp.]
MKDHEKRLIALETQLAFQDDLLEQLNQQLILQNRDIHSLQEQVRVLGQRLATLKENHQDEKQPDMADERPPHY